MEYRIFEVGKGYHNDGSEYTLYNVVVNVDGEHYEKVFDYYPTNEEINIETFLNPHLSPVQLKIQQIKLECQNKIFDGFYSTVKYGELKHYTLKDYEQSNIQALLISIIGGATHVPWRHSEIVVCDIWTAQEFQQFYQEAMVFTVNQRYKSDVIELYLTNENLTTEQINAANMDMELPTYYQDILVEKLTILGIPLWQ